MSSQTNSISISTNWSGCQNNGPTKMSTFWSPDLSCTTVHGKGTLGATVLRILRGGGSWYQGSYSWKKEDRAEGDAMRRCYSLALKTEGGAGSLWKLETSASLLEPPEGVRPCQRLDLSPRDPFYTSDLQNCKMIIFF